MTAIFLTIITVSIIIFFGINLKLSKFLPNHSQKISIIIAYVLLIIGLLGLIIYHVNFLNTPALQITLESNLPNLIKAIAELLWPIAAILGIFWFLPQILDFFNDPRKSVPLLEAFSGKNSFNNQQYFSEKIDLDNISVSEAHKELIKRYQNILNNTAPEQQKEKLLIHAANCELCSIFENVYNIIYGSQIQALQIMSVNPKIDLTPFYETHYKRSENPEYEKIRLETFDLWIKLLSDSELLKEDSNKYSLSPRGESFLEYLKNKNYYLDKPF
jgi:hypothetical protein